MISIFVILHIQTLLIIACHFELEKFHKTKRLYIWLVVQIHFYMTLDDKKYVILTYAYIYITLMFQQS